jgi:gluconokinase
MIVVLMGVSGVGKSTLGRLLATRTGWRFIDADDHHPAGNIAKMTAGIPLEDADRWPWLDALNRLLRAQSDAIIACSALKESYRQRLLAGIDGARIVYLYGAKALIGARIAERKHKFMPAALLESQFATLEPPRNAIAIDVAEPAEASVAAIAAALAPSR